MVAPSSQYLTIKKKKKKKFFLGMIIVWTGEHYTFAIEMFLKTSESVIAT